MNNPTRSVQTVDNTQGLKKSAEPDPGRVEFEAGGFAVTREYEMFSEFCDEVRRFRWLGVCTGASRVGKTAYAEHYTMWDVISPDFPRHAFTRKPPPEVVDCRSVYYKATTANTPKQFAGEVERRRSLISWVTAAANRLYGDLPGESESLSDDLFDLEDRTELLIIDEAQRLKANTLEQLRDLYDEGNFGLILMSATQKSARILSGDNQYKSRIAHVHNIKSLSAVPTRKIAVRPEIFGVNLPAEAFRDEEGVTTMVQITLGNFNFLKLLVQQIQRTLEVNELGTAPGAVTAEVIETAAESMFIGP